MIEYDRTVVLSPLQVAFQRHDIWLRWSLRLQWRSHYNAVLQCGRSDRSAVRATCCITSPVHCTIMKYIERAVLPCASLLPALSLRISSPFSFFFPVSDDGKSEYSERTRSPEVDRAAASAVPAGSAECADGGGNEKKNYIFPGNMLIKLERL